jgi:hypothetical protein
VTKDGQPRKAPATGLQMVVLRENAVNDILVDLDSEGSRDNQCDTRTTKAWISALEFDNRPDHVRREY